MCSRCVVEGDRSERQLIQCSYCGDVFCERHVALRLTMSFNQCQSYLDRYPDIIHLLREHWESGTSNLCTAFTSEFWAKPIALFIFSLALHASITRSLTIMLLQL